MCDDGNMDDDDGCSSLCLFEYQVVFISSTTMSGNLGGVQGGDAKCNALAKPQPALAGREFVAWVSSRGSPAKDRLGVSQLPYRLTTGTVVANNTLDLLDAALLAPINRDEKGAITSGSVWTGTKTDGTVNNDNCTEWTLGALNRERDDREWGEHQRGLDAEHGVDLQPAEPDLLLPEGAVTANGADQRPRQGGRGVVHSPALRTLKST
jgi:hypothetical protein